MNAQDIRNAYLKFFEDRGHKVIPRAPLVLQNDPTTLFTGSGMQQLMPFLLGQKHPEGTRLVDSQTCIRAQDIDEVGDNRHTTFFEMLGNWSLGDYFKAEQFPWMFEFLTEVVGLDPKGTPTTGTLDKRMLNNFLVGPQYQADGVTPLTDGGADVTDPDGPAITFTPYINELQPNAWRQSGARIGKWQFYKGMQTSLDNDLAIYRYADILLMKAELLARKNGNWNDPVTLALVNQIRTVHGGVTPFASLTAETFLAERGREMFAESYRRQDMLRFGTYNNAYRFHAADPDAHVNIFPIPEPQINANPNLKQNPGY